MVTPAPRSTEHGSVRLDDEQLDMLSDLAEQNDYWKNAHDFIHQVLGRELSSLSDKQVDWYYSIKAGIDREIDQLNAREAFSDNNSP